VRIISVDFQRDFSAQGGRWFRPRPCVAFLHSTIIPYLQRTGEKVAEIISDYRLPRPLENEAYCVPGTWGFESEIPIELREQERWVKSMNSPAWSRAGAGKPVLSAGTPYPDPSGFDSWLKRVVGSSDVTPEVALIGLVLDCCVLATAAELYYRGYRVYYIIEGVDTAHGDPEEKAVLFGTALSMWGAPLGWDNFLLKQSDLNSNRGAANG